MTEQSPSADSEEVPYVPDDISGLVNEIQSQAEQRRKAIDIMFKNAEVATNDDERMKWLNLAMQFVSIDVEFRNAYPELFPDNASE